MVLGDQDPPLRDRRLDLRDLHTPLGVDRLDRPVAPIRIRARVVRVGQDLVHSTVIGRLPPDPPLGDPAAREPLPLGRQLGNDLPPRAAPVPQLEHSPDRAAHLLINAEPDLAILIALQPDRQRQPQLATGRLVLKPTTQPGADQMQLRLRHRALQTEQQSVVEIGGRVDPVRVGDQRAGQRAQIQELMPVRARARQPRDLQRKDHADMPQADLGRELAKPDPGVRPPAD